MTTRGDAEPIRIRLMNEYFVDMPLWDDEGQTNGEDLGLSDDLRSDLCAFASRWEAAVPADVSDDRFDGRPVMRQVVELGRSVRRAARPAVRRDVEAEAAAIDREGELLRHRLQMELGEGYVVTYKG